MVGSKLPAEVVELLGRRLGSPVKYPSDCERLSLDVADRLHETIGVTTFKRLLGFTHDVQTPRQSTLDIIGRYCGFASYADLLESLGLQGDSDFEKSPDIDVDKLSSGDILTFTYHPAREVELEYSGNYHFRVIKSVNSSLRAGDIVITRYLSVGLPARFESVRRNDTNLGSYVAGKKSGIISVTVVKGSKD